MLQFVMDLQVEGLDPDKVSDEEQEQANTKQPAGRTAPGVLLHFPPQARGACRRGKTINQHYPSMCSPLDQTLNVGSLCPLKLTAGAQPTAKQAQEAMQEDEEAMPGPGSSMADMLAAGQRIREQRERKKQQEQETLQLQAKKEKKVGRLLNQPPLVSGLLVNSCSIQVICY